MQQIRAEAAVKNPLASITVITGNATGSRPTKVDSSVLSGATLVAGSCSPILLFGTVGPNTN